MSTAPMKFPSIEPDDVQIPEGMTLEDWIKSRTATYATRTLDWDALKFQADFDPIYRRAQMRYVGTGATGVDADENVVPAEHFTFSTMVRVDGEVPERITTRARGRPGTRLSEGSPFLKITGPRPRAMVASMPDGMP